MMLVNENLSKLPFDQYGRYKLVADFVLANKKNIKRVLDIGGGQDELLKKFLPDFDITVLDNHENNKKNYIQGSALNLPFEDKSYDLVFSCDVYEHIPNEERLTFINEQLRVAKNFVLLAAPFDNDLVRVIENNVNLFYKNLIGQEYPWLKEHLQNGLPKSEDLEVVLKKENLVFNKVGQANLLIWEKLIKFNILKGHAPQLNFDQDLNQLYNEHLCDIDFNFLPYRKVYFIELQESANLEWLEDKTNQLTTRKFIEASKLFDETYLNKIIDQIIGKTDKISNKESFFKKLINKLT